MDDEVSQGSTWKVVGPILLAVSLAIGGASLSVISVGNTRELDQHERRIDTLEDSRSHSSERLKGIEVQLGYVVEDTQEIKEGIKAQKEAVDSLTRSLVGKQR